MATILSSEQSLEEMAKDKSIMFGFGTLRDTDYVGSILGTVPKNFDAVLEGYELFVQQGTDEHIPQFVKNVLANNWDLEKFRSLYPRKTGEGVLPGRAYYLTSEQEKKLDMWEFCEPGGWYHKEDVTIKDAKGKQYRAFVYTMNCPGKKISSDTIWPLDLKDKQKMLALAKKMNAG
ncbi:MAG TPA: gamma-glutamylcyclotransferase family protein [Candidatus Nanoarchaeia archaeon]|nr:gamma-glutamylcyclotransferase family protein [Candidatus Nanoarchaeia archaeon]